MYCSEKKSHYVFQRGGTKEPSEWSALIVAYCDDGVRPHQCSCTPARFVHRQPGVCAVCRIKFAARFRHFH